MCLTHWNLGTRLAAGAAALALSAWFSGPTRAQQAVQTKEGASIVVDGTVREVFRSSRQTRVDFVVQIEVGRSEYGRAPADPRRVQAPAPGDQVYVHVYQSAGAEPGLGRPGAAGHTGMPSERSQVRAFLYPRPQGGWEGAFPDWFDQTNVTDVNRGQNDPEPPAEVTSAPASRRTSSATSGSILPRLGLRAEQVQTGGRLVLKVIDVVPESPAGKAGIEPTDAIIGVNGGFITDLDQLSEVILKGGPAASLVVLDHRSGKPTAVKVDVSGLVAEAAQHRPEPAPAPAPVPTRVLGVKIERVRVGLRSTAVRVTEVQEGSPAAKAGLEPGDVIIAANDTPIEDLDQLNASVQRSGPVMTLKVLDPRTRREVPVQVHLNSVAAATPGGGFPPGGAPLPTPAPTAPGSSASSARGIGLVVEAGTADLLPVVKVLQVSPGSPAERAGIEPGDAIVGLNDKVIFAPDLLDEALRVAGNSFTLNVLDVKSGKKTPVKISIP
jgi:S1-C subfamily serine protease